MKAGTEQLSRRARPAPLWIASRNLLSGPGEEFFARWKIVARTFDEDEVHDLRVASRRLREGLAMFSPCFPGKKISALLKQVKKVTKMLGNLRNTDEAFLFFSALAPEESAQCGHEVEELLAALRREREQARKELKKELSSLRPGPLRTDFLEIRNRPKLFGNSAADPFMSITSFADRAVRERAATLSELLPRAVREEDIPAQHQLRIGVKKMRYRLEIIAPLLRSGYEELHGALKGYQDVLGKLHDIDVFRQIVQERVADGAGRQALLRAMEERRSRLYTSFKEMLGSFPIESIGEKASKAL